MIGRDAAMVGMGVGLMVVVSGSMCEFGFDDADSSLMKLPGSVAKSCGIA
jgi:hypothetical protein